MSKSGRVAVPVAALGLTLMIAGCLSTTEVPDTLFWEGSFLIEASGPAGMAGAAAMVATARQTQVGLGITGAPVDAMYGWHLRRGRCSGPGTTEAPASTFPALDMGDDGEIDVEAVIQRRLTGTEYAVQIVENTDGTGEVLACADLTRT